MSQSAAKRASERSETISKESTSKRMETEGASREVLIWSDLTGDCELRVMPRVRKSRSSLNFCTGYHRPIKNWNKGKLSEFHDRKTYNMGQAIATIKATPSVHETDQVAMAV